MKHVYLLTVMLLTVLISNAQFNKGDKLLGGAFNISYGTGKSDNDIKSRGFGIGISPSYAWFTSPATALGIKLNGSYNHQNSDVTGSSVSSSSGHGFGYGAGFFVQKYKNLDPRLSLYAEFGIGANFSKGFSRSKYANQIQESKLNNWNTGAYITPGIMYKFSKRLLLDLSLNGLLNITYSKYKSTSVDQQNESVSKSSGFSVGSSFNNNNTSNGVGIGFKWLLK